MYVNIYIYIYILFICLFIYLFSYMVTAPTCIYIERWKYVSMYIQKKMLRWRSSYGSAKEGADLGILPVLQRVLSQKKQSELWYVMRFDEIVKFNVD